MSTLVRLSFGGKTVETQLSLREIVNRLHNSIEILNSHVKKHADITDPMQRTKIESQIAEEISRFQVFNAKLRKAFLDRVLKDIQEPSKLISDMDVRSLVARYPNYELALENIRKQTENNLKRFRDEESEERLKAHYLRKLAQDIIKKSNSIIGATIKTVKQKIAALQKQQSALSSKQQ